MRLEETLGVAYPHGESVTRCIPPFFLDEADASREGKPRLDIVLILSNGESARYHPGAKLILSTDPQPTDAMTKRMNLRKKQMSLKRS